MLSLKRDKGTYSNEKKILSHDRLFKKGIHDGALKAGRSVQKRITTMLSTGIRTGRHYSGLRFRSSAAGEVPRSQSGKLARSIGYKASGHNTLRISSNVEYAKYLEDGTENMSARPNKKLPWMKLAIQLEERNTESYLQNGVERLLC